MTHSMTTTCQSGDDQCRPTHVMVVTSVKQFVKHSGGVLEINRGLGSNNQGDTT